MGKAELSYDRSGKMTSGMGTFINFLDYKLKQKGGLLVEIDGFLALKPVIIAYKQCLPIPPLLAMGSSR